MTHFEQFIQYKALSFKFNTPGLLSIDKIEQMVKGGSIGQDVDGKFVPFTDLEQATPIKLQNVCAKLTQQLVDRLDEALGVLSMTKREFIELALIEALNKVDEVLEQTDAFEHINAMHERDQAEGKA